MIRTIRHKGLKQLFEHDDPHGVNPEHVAKLQNILATLNAAPTLAHMDLPGFRLHPLKGKLKGFYGVTVRANWRVIFRFRNGEAEDVDYVDYH
jgi:proteic killer suppression protein